MKKFLSFWVSISFLKQLIILGVALVLLIQGVSWGLKSYTQYGDTYVVPDLSGLSYEEASEALSNVQLIGVANHTYSCATRTRMRIGSIRNSLGCTGRA